MQQENQLKRQIGLPGAVMMGLGSIVGTGVFVSIGIAAGIAGPAVMIAIALGAMIAIFNGLSSAQLAAVHPVSGGTYEYGYRFLNPRLGFTAGWMFLLAKSASAATAALGFSGYLIDLLNLDTDLLVPIALAGVIALTGIVLNGIRRSNTVNIIIVSITLGTLTLFVLFGAGTAIDNAETAFSPFFLESGDGFGETIRSILWATALMFVAYTGYGRIATLGEEVKEPRRIIPRAIIVTLALTMALYIAVALVSVGIAGSEALADSASTEAAPLEFAARQLDASWLPTVVALGAITAMLGVLLNLILGLSRVLLAMGRRNDAPSATARLDASQTTPTVAVIVIGLFVAGLVLIGNVRTTWSFSAFTVLIYYAITNLSALQLTAEQRLFPRWVSWAGLFSCLFVAFWVEAQYWLIGLVLIAAGLLWHQFIGSASRSN